ncbi:DUF3618 domain-containing protein [Nocardioides marmotae]|uniref:DUF3618 domain-containing protein n=1 Tax=Nocardioides marmotae TaxID=2663857 RepID=A0A6I3J1A7_9ACTN|nr:DUF3618 domain-containing protein [Nocardioides marmotae]MCR6030420.1 DUF3618 domain-containing protein [Gordonia jinghuaiqii]MBC9734552.1 DUF3618 domain-containing protein [Nocardioides marmotae]MTB85653.1 DUF3618 domain-containing protein [Nocardioides marmotae]MTB94056.1 DUF3618 domain-containing protein [Nocardioides marmotae]QKE00363.1 DUF3618 domain-containing protein [Nocardioides marmotae]
MGQSTEELNSQIEDTRARMAGDLDALQDRVSPSAIVDRRKAAARSRVSGFRDRIMGTATGVRDSVVDKASSAGGAVSNAMPSTSDSSSPDVRGAASSAVGSAGSQVQGSPLAAGLVAFGTGLVIASLIPASKAEADLAHQTIETAKDKGQPLLDEAREAGQSLAQDVKEQATQAAQEVKDSATESAQKVKEEGQSSAESVKSDAQG